MTDYTRGAAMTGRELTELIRTLDAADLEVLVSSQMLGYKVEGAEIVAGVLVIQCDEGRHD